MSLVPAFDKDVARVGDLPLMLTLPSGWRVRLSMEAVMEPGRPWFPCAADHVWVLQADPLRSQAPHGMRERARQQWRSIPRPRNAVELADHVRVLVAPPGEATFRFEGDTVASFRADRLGGEDDWDAWETFLQGDEAIAVFARTLARCTAQARANRVLDDAPVTIPLSASPARSAERLARAHELTERVATLVRASNEHGMRDVARDYDERLGRVAVELEELARIRGPHAACALRMAARVHGHRGAWSRVVRVLDRYLLHRGDDELARFERATAMQRAFVTDPNAAAAIVAAEA